MYQIEPTPRTVIIRPGRGYWDITSFPKGGCFHRAIMPILLHDCKVVELYGSGRIQEVSGRFEILGQMRTVVVSVENCYQVT